MTTAGDPYDGSPVAALRRIAFLLERGRADTFKVQAYRKAAAAILPLPEAEVAQRAAEGTLTDLAGVGSSTARVISDAVAGRTPERLAEAEEQYGVLPVAGGDGLRAALRGDLHSHSDWSDGGSPIEEMAMTAMELGHDYLVLTDHSPRLRIARGLSVERLARQLEVVDAVNVHLAVLPGHFVRASSGCSRGSKSTSSTTALSTRPRTCWPARGAGRQRALEAGDAIAQR